MIGQLVELVGGYIRYRRAVREVSAYEHRCAWLGDSDAPEPEEITSMRMQISFYRGLMDRAKMRLAGRNPPQAH